MSLVLSLNGEPQEDLLARLIQFDHYWRHGKKPSQVTFKFNNADRALSEDPRLFSNSVWQFRWGMLNDMSEIFSYVARGEDIDYSEDRVVGVTLFDQSSNTAKHSSAKNWGRVTSSKIAEQIAKAYGFEAEIVDSGDQRVFIQPGNITDFRFLKDMADAIGFEMFVAGTPPTLYYRPTQWDAAPSGLLVYERDPGDSAYVLSFSPEIKTLGPEKHTASKTNNESGKGETGADKPKGSKLAGADTDFGAVVVSGAGKLRSMAVRRLPPGLAQNGVTTPTTTSAPHKKVAAAARQNQLERANKARSSHPLTPSIVPGKTYTWGGLDGRLNGLWLADEVHASISASKAEVSVSWKRNSDKKKASSATTTTEQSQRGAEGKAANAPIVVVDANGRSVVRRGPTSAAGRAR